MLMGAVGTPRRHRTHVWNKFVPAPPIDAAAARRLERAALAARVSARVLRDELPSAPFPEGAAEGKLATYFTRVYNPVWTNPDGFTWIEVLSDETKIGLHAALTPTWSETAWFADYVLPMGLGTERHDLMSQETHARHAGSASGSPCCASHSRSRADKTGRSSRTKRIRARCGRKTSSGSSSRGASTPTARWASASTSNRRIVPARKSTLDEYYGWIFENRVPGLPEAAARRRPHAAGVHAEIRRVSRRKQRL